MNVKELMQFVESEYVVINNTPCEICGGRYITEANGFNFENGVPSNVSSCVCESCGNKREFYFRAPIAGIKTSDSMELN